MCDELDDLSFVLILVRKKDLDSLSPFSLRNIEDLRVLSFPILLNLKGHRCDVDGYNLSNTKAFKLDIALSPSSSLSSSSIMY